MQPCRGLASNFEQGTKQYGVLKGQQLLKALIIMRPHLAHEKATAMRWCHAADVPAPAGHL
jgi:hypothetical protein